MIISLINHSIVITDEQVQEVIRAINRQLKEDFEPYWSFSATLRLEGPIGKRPGLSSFSDMRGDAVLYLVDGVNSLGATGWHLANYGDIPYGIVFLGLCAKIKEAWSITLSHEALELVGDPMCNLLVQGNDPLDRRRRVFHLFEMCDAVQAESYSTAGVALSNFVLPSYFSLGEQPGRHPLLLRPPRRPVGRPGGPRRGVQGGSPGPLGPAARPLLDLHPDHDGDRRPRRPQRAHDPARLEPHRAPRAARGSAQ